jgi:hypothetical protein
MAEQKKSAAAGKASLTKNIEFTERYVYNKETDQYITYVKALSKPIVINGKDHRAMKKAYCGEDGRSIEEICLSRKFPEYLFNEYKSIHAWTRKSCPLTNEEILDNTVEESVESILNDKYFEVLQEVEKRSWKNTEENAKKWTDFKADTFDPFIDAINDWEPPKIAKLDKKPKATKSDAWFVMGISDFQIGSEALERYLFRQKEWSTELAKEAVDKLFSEILQDINDFNFNFEGCCLLLAGDLFHGLRGETEKGTSLKCDLLRDDQCDAILTILTCVIKRLADVFDKVEIHSVKGNHDGADHYPIMVALKNYFHTYEQIEFNVYSTRTALFKIKNTLILLDHGASDEFRSEVPKNGKPRESYVQSLLLAHPEKLIGVNQKLFIQGDKHHYEQIEFNDFEFIMMGALPLGDQYADNSNLHARPRQNCFVINEDGLKSVLHYYIK